MKTLLGFALLVLVASLLHAAAPVVTNVQASQIPGTKNIQITYNISDADGDLQTIAVQVSGDAGLTYTIPATALSGHVGAGVAPGTGRTILWNAGTDWNGQYVPLAKVRITAHDGTTPPPPPGMVYIPAGVFQMGDNLDGDTNALPLHNVTLDAFFMDRTEVAKEQWQAVQTWSAGNGYSISAGSFKASGHPVQSISWYDAVKWCNARSEKEGLMPCYYTDTAQTVVYRTGSTNITNAMVKWSASGYRLPTEAEWERAARGGLHAYRFPWQGEADASKAGYGMTEYVGTSPCSYYNGSQTPPGIDMTNGFGLYDMAGNVWEWCWDWYSSAFYSDPAALTEPVGPNSGTQRVIRGGAWNRPANEIACAYRYSLFPSDRFHPSNGVVGNVGLRCMRGL